MRRPKPRKKPARPGRGRRALADRLDRIAVDVALAGLELRRVAAESLSPSYLTLADMLQSASFSIADAAGEMLRGPVADPGKPVIEVDPDPGPRGIAGVDELNLVGADELRTGPVTRFALERLEVYTVGDLTKLVAGLDARGVSAVLGIGDAEARDLLGALASYREWFLRGFYDHPDATPLRIAGENGVARA